MNVVVNGLMTNYQKVGKGPLVVCLPGWADTGASFSKLAEKLQTRYTILSLDLPGFGGTQMPPNAWGLKDYANFVSEWLQKLDEKNVYAIIGHSYGGAVAIYGLSDKDFAANKLVLLASAGIRNKSSTRKKILKVAAKVAKGPLYLLPNHTRHKLRDKFYGAIGSDLTLLPHMELIFKRIIGEDVQAKARNLKLPTLLIYGKKDKDTPIADGQKLAAAIPNAKLDIIDGGHFLHQEQVNEASKLILEFLEHKSD